MDSVETPSEATSLQPIARRQISTEVAHQIQHFIASNRLQVGDRLPPERELAESLEVSRGAVREGIKLLAAVGTVEVRQGAGTFVKEAQRLVLLDPSHLGSEERRAMLIQATMVRKLIDCSAAELAAVEARDDDIVDLEGYLKLADEALTHTRLAFNIDLTFEQMVGKAARNPYLSAVQQEAHRYFEAAWTSVGYMPRPASERSEQHWEIFRALKARDPGLARAAMERHFDLQLLREENSIPAHR